MLRSLIDPNDAPRALFCPTPRARDTEKSHRQAQKAPEAAPRGASAPDTPRRCRGRSSRSTALPGAPSNFESPSRSPIASALDTWPCPADLTRCAGIDASCVVSTTCRSTSMTGCQAPSGAKRRHASSRGQFPRGHRFRISCSADGHDQRERRMGSRCDISFSGSSCAFLRFRVSLPHT